MQIFYKYIEIMQNIIYHIIFLKNIFKNFYCIRDLRIFSKICIVLEMKVFFGLILYFMSLYVFNPVNYNFVFMYVVFFLNILYS